MAQPPTHAHTLIYVHEEPTSIYPYFTVDLRFLTAAYASICIHTAHILTSLYATIP